MLQIELKTETLNDSTTSVEVPLITPDRVARLAVEVIAGLPVSVGNQSAELGDFFSVTGDPIDRHHVWKGDCSRISSIGYQMQSGWIQVQGAAGNHLGGRMSGGTIQVQGSTGDFVGCEMSGGLIHVKGNVGSHVGSAYDGGVAGQNGGAILIEGSAKSCVGEAMRRGLIAVAHNVGNCCGLTMRAGTIIVHGSAGKNLAAEMTRGTIVLAGDKQSKEPPRIPSGFVSAGSLEMPILRLLNRHTAELGFSKLLTEAPCRLFHGDMLRGGRGELLVTQ